MMDPYVHACAAMSDCKNLVSYADSSNISPCIGHQRNYKQKMIANYDGVMGEGRCGPESKL